MSEKRLFTDEELKEMGGRTLDAIQQAIDAGELERAKGLSRRMYREFLGMHDVYRDWVTALLSFVGRRYGDEVLYEALKESCTVWLKPYCDIYSKEDARRRAMLFAGGIRGHLTPIRVEEDDEKVTFFAEPCGSGGRLILEGKYDPPWDFLKVKNAQAMTFDREDFPVYCAHCPFEELVPQELMGHPLVVTEPPERLGHEPCRIHLYKDPKAAPRR